MSGDRCKVGVALRAQVDPRDQARLSAAQKELVASREDEGACLRKIEKQSKLPHQIVQKEVDWNGVKAAEISIERFSECKAGAVFDSYSDNYPDAIGCFFSLRHTTGKYFELRRSGIFGSNWSVFEIDRLSAWLNSRSGR